MARLSHAQQEVRNRLQELAGCNLLPEAAAKQILALLQIVIPADCGVLFGVDPTSLLFNRILAINEGCLSGTVWWLQNIYLARETLSELTFPNLMQANLSTVSIQDLPHTSLGIPPAIVGNVSPRRWQRIYYEETLTPHGGLLRACFGANRQWIAALELFRLERGNPFRPSDIGFVRLLAPLIGRLLAKAFERERALTSAAVGPDVSGILVLGADGRVKLCTPAAEAWSKFVYDTQLERENALPTAIWSAVARFRAGTSRTTAPDLHVWTPAGNLRVEVSHGDEDGSTAVVLSPERPPTSLDLPAHWALTPQERQIVLLLARGLSNRDIASTLVVTESTVESHLVHIYEKLYVRSRSELLARLFSELFLPRLQSASCVLE